MATGNLRSRLLSVEVRFTNTLQSGAPDRMSKVVDVSQVQAIWLIFMVLDRLETCSNVRGARPVSDSHVVETGSSMKVSRLPC